MKVLIKHNSIYLEDRYGCRLLVQDCFSEEEAIDRAHEIAHAIETLSIRIITSEETKSVRRK